MLVVVQINQSINQSINQPKPTDRSIVDRSINRIERQDGCKQHWWS